MKILMILDSMELNGGSTMFLEMLAGFRKYHPEYTTEGIVVSKTGQYGRRGLVSKEMVSSYGSEIPSMKYEEFEKKQSDYCDSETVVVHHRLQCTRPLTLSCPYIVVNHTVQSPHRIANFKHANAIVSVCKRIAKQTGKYVKSEVILNGVENEYINDISPSGLGGSFNTGRCHRLVKLKQSSLVYLSTLKIKGHHHYLAGPTVRKIGGMKNITYLGSIFNRQKKMAFIKSLDVYFYDTNIDEGASIAVLEALASGIPVVCRPLGGTPELVTSGVNGYYFKDYNKSTSILKKLADRDYLKEVQSAVRKDFDDRLHIKHMLNKYIGIFNKI